MRVSQRTVFAFLLVLLLAAGVRLLTFQRFLPYVEYPDEPSLYLMGQDWRGIRKTPASVEGYPPGYIWINGSFQVVVEALIPNRWIPAWEYYRALRLLAAFASLVTTAFVIQLGWQLGSWFGDSEAARWVGILSGLLWAVSPSIVDNSSLAIADPFVYLFCAVALWLAVIALRYRQIRALTGCLVACIGAIYCKYTAVFILIPWGMAALNLLWRRVGNWRWWLAQGLLAAFSVIYLVFIYKAFSLSIRESNAMRDSGLSLMFTPSRLLNNLDWTFRALDSAILGLGLLFCIITLVLARRRQPRSGGFAYALLMLALYFIVGVFISAGFIVLSSVSRHTLPAVIALIAVVACALVFGIQTLFRSGTKRLGYIIMLALVIIPNLSGNVDLLKQYSHPDTRYLLWKWSDASLPADQMILLHSGGELERVWNRDWSGYDGVKEFRWWWTTSETPQTPLADYLARGIGYFAMSEGDRVRLYNTPEMQAWISQLWLVKTFHHLPDQPATPDIYFYRLARPQVSVAMGFGDQLRLIGYDTTLESGAVTAGTVIHFRPYWQTIRPPQANYSMFVHIYRSGETAIIAQQDGTPGTRQRLTLQWDDPNEVYIGNEVQLTLSSPLPPGAYELVIGLYNFTTGARLKTSDGIDHVSIPFRVIP
jgi:hypothetical protein